MSLMMDKTHLQILVIEDDGLARTLIRSLLKAHDLAVFPSLQAFFASPARADRFDLAIVDLCHPDDPEGRDSPEMIARLRQLNPELEIIVQSGVRDINVMRACLRHGAQGFLIKEHLAAELPAQVEIVSEYQRIRTDLDQLIVGKSPSIRQLKQDLFRLKVDGQGDVLITGETGSGKELCAMALQKPSMPFVTVAASALPKDLFESELFGVEKGAFTGAQVTRPGFVGNVGRGVLFLDEIQSLHLESQTKLLRFVENREYHRVGSSTPRSFQGRLVFAANEELSGLVDEGKFRNDLYFRIYARKVDVPPLRQRREDIPLLVAHYLKKAGAKKEFTPDALEFLKSGHSWPGNIRELFQVLGRVLHEVRIPLIDVEEVWPHVQPAARSKATSTSATKALTPATALTPDYTIDWSLGFDANCARFERHLLRAATERYGEGGLREGLKLAKTRFYQKLSLLKDDP